MGGSSGAGSYGRLAEFKASHLNRFVSDNNVMSVIEFGCGDGNQLSLARYPRYLGLDVSHEAVARCRDRFQGDASKTFSIYDPDSFDARRGDLCAELSLSLDVIYHLVEDDAYEAYMANLFLASEKFVIIYSTDYEEATSVAHVRHRAFPDWVRRNCPGWKLLNITPNRFPADGDSAATSNARFYEYAKA
jgi:hypothetical protein